MATQAQLNAAARQYDIAAAHVATCVDVAHALLEVGEGLVASKGFFSSPESEYERNRKIIINACTEGRRLMELLRQDTISPALIRGMHGFVVVGTCCERCLAVNSSRLAEGKAFVCLIGERSPGVLQNQFRFMIAEKGQIRETSNR
jgi:hypothetical protein